MSDVDVSRIVPSTRDLLGALAMRRQALALVPLLDDGDLAAQMGRFDDLGVRAAALSEPGERLALAARSSRDMPMLCLAAVASAADCQRARYFGADGVCVAAADEASWSSLSKSASSMRMMPLALAADAADVERAAGWGARAVLLRAPDLDAALSAARAASRATVLVAAFEGADADGLRALAGHVDAAVVAPAMHRAEGFGSLLEELDS